jgi:hypothetical protein
MSSESVVRQKVLVTLQASEVQKNSTKNSEWFSSEKISTKLFSYIPITVVLQFKGSVCGRSLAGIGGYNAAGGRDVCVLSCLCEEPITRPEESYRLGCVTVCDLETPT